MAVQLVSDLVMDVMRAAEPVRAQAAARKLAGGAAAVDTVPFKQALRTAASPRTLTRDIVADVMAAAEPARRASAQAKLAAAPADAVTSARAFQSVVLASALDELMPKGDDGGLYGSGTAGNVWRSMAGEQMATALAGRDVLGLNQRLATAMTGGGSTAAWPFAASGPIRPFTST